MPHTTQGSLDPQLEFCLALKAARQRRGLTLDAIAGATKVCPSHFSALERGDLRHWPKGLYRRTFFRAYAETIGLPAAATLEQFIRLFPDDERTPASTPAPPALPLVLDPSWHGPKAPIVRRTITAVIDAIAVSVLAIAGAWSAGLDAAITVAIVAVSYFTLATLLLGDSPAAWALARRSLFARAWQRGAEEMAVESAAPESDGEYRMGEEQSWTTDARRVRPRGEPPRMRVRFKWS
jgi:transcriptional regulator with XRE-family HTH domain